MIGQKFVFEGIEFVAVYNNSMSCKRCAFNTDQGYCQEGIDIENNLNINCDGDQELVFIKRIKKDLESEYMKDMVCAENESVSFEDFMYWLTENINFIKKAIKSVDK